MTNTTEEELYYGPGRRAEGKLIITEVDTPANAACLSFILGSLFAFAFANIVSGSKVGDLLRVQIQAPIYEALASKRLSGYLLFNVLFHFTEYTITAIWNAPAVNVGCFAIHSAQHQAANLFAITEFVLEEIVLPARWLQIKRNPYWLYIGIPLLLTGYAIRSIAMIQAATNFNHSVQSKKKDDHELVTRGLYSWSRHPAYAGFFYWSLGMQVYMGNPISIVAFLKVLHWYFNKRITYEEQKLLSFFGKGYEEYRHKVPTRMPLVG